MGYLKTCSHFELRAIFVVALRLSHRPFRNRSALVRILRKWSKMPHILIKKFKLFATQNVISEDYEVRAIWFSNFFRNCNLNRDNYLKLCLKVIF